MVGKGIVAGAAAAAALALVVAGCASPIPPTTVVQPSAAVGPSGAPASGLSAASPTAAVTAAATPVPIVVAAGPVEPALKELWQAGGPKLSNDGACCVAVAPDGKLWATAEWDASFWIIDPDGRYLESWGTAGKGDGQFNFVVNSDGFGAVAFDPDGTFYVADTGNRRIQKFDKDRKFVRSWGEFGTGDGQFVTPSLVVTNGRGHVYVQDLDRLDVQEFTSDGAFLRTLASGALVYFMAIDNRGHLYVDDGPRIRVFDVDGTQLPGFDLSSTGALASGMALDAEGNLFVATVSSYNAPILTKGIYEIDAGGKVLHAWPGEADSLALDPKGGALYSSFFADPFIRKLELPKP